MNSHKIVSLSDFQIEELFSSELRSSMDLGRFLFLPDRRVYCLVFRAYSTPKTLHEMTEITEKAGLTVLSGYYFALKANGKEVAGFAFIDFTDGKMKPEEFVEEMEQLEVVKFVKLISPTKSGFISDIYFFPLIVSGERVVLLRKSICEGFLSMVRERFGTAGEAFLYYVGFDVGTKALEDYRKLSASTRLEDIIVISRALSINMGWNVPEVVEIDLVNKRAVIRIHESFECELGKKEGKPYSQFLRGVIAGIFSGIFRQNVKVEEVKCIAKGDPYCEFQIKAI